MKRLLCMILAGLMLLTAAACTADSIPQLEIPTDAPSLPSAVTEAETTPEPEATPEPSEAPADESPAEEPVPVPLSPIPIDNPPIDLTDPVKPIFETEGTEITVDGYSDFTNLLSAAILSGTQNRNLSPISVYLALAMVAEGAENETKAELLALLGCKDLKELRGVCGAMLETLIIDDEKTGSTVDIQNSLWMADKIAGEKVTFRDSFLKALSETYRSEANTVEFGTQSAKRQIADWITNNTHGKIKVSPDALEFDPATLAVLINTIYLKAGWQDTFSPENTETGTFYTPDGETDVRYMNRFDRNGVVRQGDGWIAYRVWLNRVGYVTFVLPDEGVELSKLLGTPDAIDKLLHAGYNKNFNVSLKIPKFKFQDKMELTEILEAIGLRQSFTPGADFSGMSDMPCCINSVIQESFIGVDENGVEAAAYTMISMKATGFSPVELERLDFHLTRPFFYAIESKDGQVLFIGTVTNPGMGE